MKKICIALCGALLLGGALIPSRVEVAHADTKSEIKALIDEYNGNYTKKTEIAITEGTIKDLKECFHADQKVLKRSTYYTPNKLLLAAEDGSIPKDSGSYYFDSSVNKVKRAAALEGSTEENMWTNLGEGVVAYSDEVTALSDKFVTLDTFSVADYSGWEPDTVNGGFYYNLTTDEKKKDDQHRYQCKMWNDFLAFCAPMLYEKCGEYLSAKSLHVKEKYDHSGTEYLALTMYLEDGDKTKLTQSYLAQARVYKGNVIFEEDLSFAVYLVGKVGGKQFKEEMIWNSTTEANEIKDLAFSKGDLLEVWDTNNNYHHTFEHKWSNSIEYGGTYNNMYKVGMSSNSYEISYKPNDGKKISIKANKDIMLFKPNGDSSTGWLKDGAALRVLFKDGSGDIGYVNLSNPDSDGYFKYEVPEGATKCVYQRFKGDYSDLWSTSGDCILANADWNNAFYQWSDQMWNNGWTYSSTNVGSWSAK